MKLPAVLLASLLTILSALGQEPRPNTLTPKEIADGWLLLFDGESTFGWKTDGQAKAAGGVLVLGGDKASSAELTTAFGNFEIRFEYQVQGKPGAIRINDSRGGLVAGDAKWQSHFERVERDAKTGKWLLTSSGGTVESSSKGNQNRIAFEAPAGGTLTLRNVKLKPLGLQSIFTGKDLSGWKEHAGKKSKFAVVDGAINIKDGPGDLQTEGQWADFVLQLECISNGKHLNSGIFFRCIPGQYQNGYEAQVRNQFTPEAAQDYTIEVYEPATNKLVDKRKIKSPAVDFGTGAIYRRMPARKELAKDGEWFTMTVLAHGRHIATWVNGVQQVDWTDQRAPHENPRNGYRAEKGPISLQGHDPTTDLSFRHFRIAELPGR